MSNLLQTKNEIKDAILHSIEESVHARVYFRNDWRPPMYGTFLALSDHDELEKKGLVRFLDNKYDPADIKSAKIFGVHTFSMIKIFS